MLHVSNSFRRFLHDSDNRVAQFVYRAIRYWDKDYPCHRLMVRWDEVNYLTLRDDGTISYLPKGKEHKVTDDGRWARDGRQNGRPANVIQKVLTPKALKLFKPTDLEGFANRYKAACIASRKTFTLLPSKEIPRIYNMDREEGGSTLSDSCMNGDGEYMKIYTECQWLQILTLTNPDGLLSGRALVWTIGDEVIMDRIYCAKDEYFDLFLDYADKHGWVRKVRYKSCHDKSLFYKNGETFEKRYEVQTATDFSLYPYIDTFTYGGDGWLSNVPDDHEYEYTCTGGGREGGNRVYCARTQEMVHRDDAVYISYGRFRGEYIHNDYSVYCETDSEYYWENDDLITEIDGRFYRTDDDDICYVESEGEYRMAEDYVYSEYHGDYIACDESIYSDYHNDYLRTDDAVKTPDGKVWHKNDIQDC